MTRQRALNIRLIRSNISDAGQRFRSTKLAGAVIRGALTLAVLSALLLIAARPAQAQTETVLYSFCSVEEYGNCTDGAFPESNLTFHGGNLYGMTNQGGAFALGTVFELSPNGGGGWNETVLHSFCSECGDGWYPGFASVIFDSLGNLYGAAWEGGAYGDGVVFELSPVGKTWTYTILFNFGREGPGFPVNGLIMDRAGNLYGTSWGGVTSPWAVFELSPSGGGWTEQLIYALSGSGNCCNNAPSGLTMDADGNIFGAAGLTLFELSPNGDGGWNPTVIHTFWGEYYSIDGTPVLDKAGNLYVTLMHVNQRGALGAGEVYKLTRKNGEWTANSLLSWQGGSGPEAGVVLDAAGNIYGTTVGGSNGQGSVFELVAPVGKGSYEEKVLWNFNGTDGNEPLGSLILDSAGNLYGTTYMGGSGGGGGQGVVFEVIPAPAATTTLTSSQNPSTYGQAITFTAAVSSTAGTPPNGEIVTFNNGSAVLGTAPLSAGMASLTTSSLPAGIYTITASYAGDANFAASTSAGLRQVVNSTTKSATATTLSSTLNPSIYGQSVTWTATVTTSGSVPPTGTVTFTWGDSIGRATLSASGVATLTKSNLNADTYPLTAVYAGDASNLGSTSPVLNQVITQARSSATLTSSPNPSSSGAAVTFTATITSPTVRATGPVTFAAGKAVLGTAQLSGGKAELTISTLAVGSTAVKATYYGDSNIAKSSASVTQTVQP